MPSSTTNLSPTAAIATPHYLATRAGATILQQGGNAFDAAVATSLAIGIVQPYHSGMGGGCCIHYRTSDGISGVIQARGDAPAAMTPERFWDAEGKPIHRLASEGGLAILVPSLVAGLHALHEKFGHLAWSEVCMAPLHLASAGFPVDFMMARLSHLPANRAKLDQFSNGAALGQPQREGALLIQPELAETLAAVAADPRALYTGPIAESVVRTTQAAGGLLTLDDMVAYRPRTQQPWIVTYRGWRIFAPQTPTVGALQAALALQILDHFALSEYLPGSVEHLHLVAEALKLTYMVRAGLESEADALAIPESTRANEMATRIQLDRAIPFAPWPTVQSMPESGCTSHFSVADAAGNVVAQTQTVRSWYGSGVVDPVTGILLNDNVGDFSLREGDVTNQGIRYNGRYNLVAPGAAPASSQSPMIAIHEESGDMIAVGAAGGPTIVSATVQALINCIDFGMDARASAAAPRVHCHGPELDVEPGVRVAHQLAALGHTIKARDSIAILQLVRRADGVWDAGADPRGPGAAGVLAGDERALTVRSYGAS